VTIRWLVDAMQNRRGLFLLLMFATGSICSVALLLIMQASTGMTYAEIKKFGHVQTALIGGFSLPMAIVFFLYRRANELGSHGTARWACPSEIKALATGVGVIIGGYRLKYSRGKLVRGEYLFDNGPAPVILVAPTRAGKGAGFVVPTLLTWNESAVVIDVKGENYQLTAGARQRYAGRKQANKWKGYATGSKILAFNPTEFTDENSSHAVSCGYNPLQEVPVGTTEEVQVVQNIAQLIVDPDGTLDRKSDPHWDTNAAILLTAAILHQIYSNRSSALDALISRSDLERKSLRVTDEKGRPLRDEAGDLLPVPSLPRVLDALSNAQSIMASDEMDSNALRDILREWAEFDHSSAFSLGLEPWWGDGRQHPVVRQIAAEMIAKPTRELGSIFSTAVAKLGLFRDPAVRQNTAVSFDHEGRPWSIMDLVDSDRPCTLYIMPNPESRERLKPLVRLLISQLINRLTRSHQTTRKYRLLLMLDEFPLLGRMTILEESLAYISGYGIKAYLIVQDFQQLYKIYSNYQSFIGNCQWRIALAPSEVTTAKYLSESLGTQTYHLKRRSRSGGVSMKSGSTSVSSGFHSRSLATPDELMAMRAADFSNGRPADAVVIGQGRPPMKVQAPLYYEDAIMRQLTEIPPPYSMTPEKRGLNRNKKTPDQRPNNLMDVARMDIRRWSE